MAAKRKADREGSTRYIDATGKWECIIQAKYPNPKTGNPKRIKRIGKTEDEAVEACKLAVEQWEKAIEAGYDQKIDKKKTFGQYMTEYIEEEVRGTITASGYHSYISAMKNNFYSYPISNLQLPMLNKVEFQNYYDEILMKKSRKTCSFPRQLCVRCCDWLMTKSILKENYARQATLKKEVADGYDRKRDEDLKKQKKVFTPEDIQKFYYAYKNNLGQYPVVVLFLLETGLRVSEFASLRNSNVDLEKGRIDIVETRSIRFKDDKDHSAGVEQYVKVPKNKKERFVMLSELAVECAKYMQEQTKLHCRNNPEDLLYPVFLTGKRRSSATMEVGFKTLCDKLGIDRDVRVSKTGTPRGLCLHSLRYTADSIANSARGANVVNTALMMGHTAIKTENVYTHATEEGLKSVTTVSQALLPEYQKQEQQQIPKELKDMSSEEIQEMYQMYQKLKCIFEK